MGLKLLGCYVIELYLDIYLTNSACIGLCVLGFRPEHSMYFVLDQVRKGTLQVKYIVSIVFATKKVGLLKDDQYRRVAQYFLLGNILGNSIRNLR